MSGAVVTTLILPDLVRPTNILAVGRDLYISDEAGWNEPKLLNIAPDGSIRSYDCASRHEGKDATLLNTLCRFLNNACGILFLNDTLYIADAIHHKIFTLSPNGLMNHIAGPWSYQTGTNDGMASEARFNHPGSITAIGDTLYVADAYNNRIRKITPDGAVTTFAGSNAGYVDGVVTQAKFNNPHGIVAVGKDLYVADSSNHCIRKIASNGVVTTIAGSDKGNEDGRGTDARFYAPMNITAIEDTLYVVDMGNRRIRKIDLGIAPTGENRARKQVVLEELRTLPRVEGIFPGGIEFQEAEERFLTAQSMRNVAKRSRKKKRSNRRTRKRD